MDARIFHLVCGRVTHPLLPGVWLLGRSSRAGIVVSDSLASREHAVLRVTRDGLTLQDLDSRNGTLVNGKPVSGSVTLRAGDVIGIGRTRYELVAGSGSDDETPIPWEEEQTDQDLELPVGTDSPEAGVDESGVDEPIGERTIVEAGSGEFTIPEGMVPAVVPAQVVLLVLEDREWADAIDEAAHIHANLDVRIVDAGSAREEMARIDQGALLLDVEAVGVETRPILQAWGRRGPVLVSASRHESEGAQLARQLGVSGYVRRRKPSILVVAAIRFRLQRAAMETSSTG